MKKLIKRLFTVNILLFLLIFVCFACNKEKTLDTPSLINTPIKDTATTVGGQLRYLALGDSYTIGQDVTEGERFPAQTAKILESQNLAISTIDYIATTGWTTGNLVAAINAQNPPKNYNIVTLLIGVNDQYQHMDTTGYRTRFTSLLNTAIQLAADKRSNVFVLSIPDYSVTPYVSMADKATVSAAIDAFNAINKRITLENNVPYVDITPTSRDAATDPTLIAGDGLHPSGKQYAQWAALLAPVIKKGLK